MSRRMMLEKELNRFVDELRRDSSVQSVIVFGSMAEGLAREESDIDLVVVKESDEPFLDRLRAVRRRLRPRLASDFLVYTPGEWAELCRDRPFVRREIAEKGKVLYERVLQPVA